MSIDGHYLRAPVGCLWVALGAFLFPGVAATLAAAPLELPAEMHLGPEPIRIELEQATIEIVREPGIESALRARLRSPSEKERVSDTCRKIIYLLYLHTFIYYTRRRQAPAHPLSSAF